MGIISDSKWRYATKKFDASKKVSNEDLQTLKEAIQLASSSYGLQLYKVLIVENEEIRKELQPASWGQTQIVDASHLFVFCNYTEVTEKHLNDFGVLKSKQQGIELEKLSGYISFIQNQLSSMSPEAINIWTAKQTYIALANLLNACAELRIDACPMEGFEAEKYNEILDLTDKGLSAAVVCTVGYRSSEDDTQHAPKVRKEFNDLFEVVK